ncbi:MAG: DUF4136 domain-containing protein [Gemmatimonadota bacterium]|jgi:hypothetical protein
MPLRRTSLPGAPGLLRVLAAACLLLSGGCYPGSTSLEDEDYDTVVTVHDPDVDFGSYGRYALPDTVIHIQGDGENDVIELPRDYDDLILSLARANMSALGYQEESDPETNGADLVLLVAAVGTESVDWFYQDWWAAWGWYPGWGYYPPGWGSGWGWGYPPGYIVGVRIEQGTVLMTMVDPNAADPETEELPVVWAAAARGLLSGGGAEDRITDGVNQAFVQSPYLGR